MINTIILIGMPNSGKTNIGKLLSRDMNKNFIDTDEFILNKTKLTPREIVIKNGEDFFLKQQQDILLKLDISNSIVSTGGSVVYNKDLMLKLQKEGYIIYLNGNLEELSQRMTKERKIVGSKSKNFEELYKERNILYKKYCNLEIDCTNKSIEIIKKEIEKEVEKIG